MLGTVSPKHFQCAGQVLTVNPRGFLLPQRERREERGERREERGERREEGGGREERGREERREAERREEGGERREERREAERRGERQRGEERFWWRVMQISLSCCDRCQLTSQDQLTSNQ